MAITASTLRRYLRDAFDDSVAFGRTLYEQLRLREREAGNNLKGGSKSSVSGAGTSVAFSTTGLTAEDEVDAYSQLVELCESVIATLGVAATDTEIKAAMMEDASVQECTSYRPDFSSYGGGR